MAVGQVKAASVAVFAWAVDGTNLVGLSSTGSTVVTSPNAPTGGDYFSVAVSGSGSSQDIFVSDAVNHTLTEFTWNGTNLQQNTTVFQFESDPSGGAISPQELTLDPEGNLWTTSFDGQIQEYTNPGPSGCTNTNPCAGTTIIAGTTSSTTSPVNGARGILITGPTSTCDSTTTTGCTAYVTYDGPYGSGGLDYFSASGSANPTVTDYATLGSTTTGNQETGQLRGVAMDPGGNLYYVDSTWGASGTDNGYVCEVVSGTTVGSKASKCTYSSSSTTTKAFLKGLNGPNQLASGPGTASGTNENFGSNCDVLYLANFYADTITEINTDYQIGSTTKGSCGSAAATETFASSLTGVSGVALVPATGVIGDSLEGPTFLFGDTFTDVDPAPEPGTSVLMLSAFLAAGALLALRRRRAAQG